MVRARDEKGHFIPDNPDTPEVDEAWVEKKVSKTKKKKTTKKIKENNLRISCICNLN